MLEFKVHLVHISDYSAIYNFVQKGRKYIELLSSLLHICDAYFSHFLSGSQWSLDQSILYLLTASLWVSWHNVWLIWCTGGVFTTKNYTGKLFPKKDLNIPNTSISISFGCSNDKSWIRDSIYDLNNRVLQFAPKNCMRDAF